MPVWWRLVGSAARRTVPCGALWSDGLMIRRAASGLVGLIVMGILMVFPGLIRWE